MKSRIFHKGFYLDTLKRMKGFALFTIIFSIASSAIAGLAVMASYDTALETNRTIEISILSLFDMVSMASSLATFFVPVLTFMAFSFLYKRNESDFFETLPIKRGAMAISGLLAVISVFAISLFGSLLVYILTSIPCVDNYYIIDTKGLLLELLATVLAAILAASVSLLGISITGVLISGVGVTISVILAPRMLMNVFLSTLESHNSSLVAGRIIPLFNPEMNIHFALLRGSFKAQQTPWNYVYTAVAGIIALIIAVALFKRRGSEAVTHRYVKHIHRHVVSILISMLPIALALEFFTGHDDMIPFGIIMLIIALIVFIVHEKVGCGKRNKNRGGFLAFVCLIIVSSIYFAGLQFADKELSDYQPEPEEIEYVSVLSTRPDNGWLGDLFGGAYLDYSDYVEMRAESIEIRDDEVTRIISKALKSGSTDSLNKSAVTVKIKSNGKVNYRKVYLSEEEYLCIKTTLAENDGYNAIWLNIDEGARYPNTYYNGFQISSENLGPILEVMKNEIAEYGAEMYREAAYYGYGECIIHYTIYYEGEEYTVSLPVYEYMTKTIEKLEKARKYQAEKELSEFKNALSEMISDGTLGSVSLNCYIEDDYYYLDIDATSVGFDVEAFASELSEMLTSDAIGDYTARTMNITLCRKGLLGGISYSSYSFAIDSSLSVEELKVFYDKYEAWLEIYE